MLVPLQRELFEPHLQISRKEVNKSPHAMPGQINHLFHSQKLTARQIAKQLHIDRKLVTKTLREETICQCYRIRVEYLGQEDEGNTLPLKGWYREIQIKGDRTLNELNDFMQHVLGWDNTHLYSFTIHDKLYSYLGQDDSSVVEVVENVFENHCSTKIPLHLLGLCENDQVIYNTDFGDARIFLLTVTGIGPTTDKNCLPLVMATMGKDLMQYEPHDPCDIGRDLEVIEDHKCNAMGLHHSNLCL